MNSKKHQQGIAIQIIRNFKNIDLSLSRLKKLIKAVCSQFGLSEATINIKIVDDAEISRLNNQFLNRNSTTDCLSFNLSDGDNETAKFDLIVNAEMAVRQANLRGHSSEAELALYITHSLLHNLGFNDYQKQQAKKMHDTEDEILQQLGYGLIYNKGIRA